MDNYASGPDGDNRGSGTNRYGHMPSASMGRFRPEMFSSSPKHPPYWGPELERDYPFRHWEKDVSIWAAGTDVDALRLGPLLAARLGGMARALAHTIPLDVLCNGQIINGTAMSGLYVLLRGLARRFAPFAAEASSRSMMEYLGFRR